MNFYCAGCLDSSEPKDVPLARQTSSQYHKNSEERTMNTFDAVSVDAERNEKLKKAKPEDSFYNVIDGEKVSSSKRLSVINPATGEQLVLLC